MLGPADDLLIHQTSEPVRYPATSDRRFYDRYFFTGHACNSDLFFMLGMGLYPNLGVIDAFASVAYGATQSTTRASRELGNNRLDTVNVGPFGVEVVEGLRRLRFWCRSDLEPLDFDLEWNGAVPAFEEPPLFTRTLGRVLEQGTRFIQTGKWNGYLRIDQQRFELNEATAWGARDRSWGVRSIGLEREPRGIMQAHGTNETRTTLWIWSPMQFEHYSIHFSLGEYPDGEREIETVRRVTSFARGGEVEVLRGAAHDLKFDLKTRELLDGSSVSFLDGSERRTVRLIPLRRAYLRAGTGYGGPDDWRHGKYMGAEWVNTVRYDLGDESVTAKIGPTHVLCRMEMDNGDLGFGTFETQIFGAYPRYGFLA